LRRTRAVVRDLDVPFRIDVKMFVPEYDRRKVFVLAIGQGNDTVEIARAEGQPNWETTFGRAPDLSPGIFRALPATFPRDVVAICRRRHTS
jgi:hypothetical protein